MVASKFDPLKNGLPYKNGSFNVGAVGWTVLCGGISYTALDYFETGILPPKSPKTPADSNPMADYLYRRQLTAHFYTWHLFTAAWSGSLPVIGLLLDPLFSDHQVSAAFTARRINKTRDCDISPRSGTSTTSPL